MMPQNITVYIWLSTQHSIWSQDSYIIIYAMTNHEYHCTDTHHTCNRLSYIAHLLTLWCFTWHLIFILTLLDNLARFKNLISVLYSEANFLPTHYEILHLILNVFLHCRVKLENMQLLPISVLSLYVKPQNSSCQTCCRLGSRDLYPGDQNVLKTVSVELNVCISQGSRSVWQRRFLWEPVSENGLKSVYICRHYEQKSSALFFSETRCIYSNWKWLSKGWQQ